MRDSPCAKAKLELLVRWQGYDLTYNSWECDADVLDRALVRRFLPPTPRPSTLTTRATLTTRDPHAPPAIPAQERCPSDP